MKQNAVHRLSAGRPGAPPPLSREQETLLGSLRALCRRLGRTPLREELPPWLRMGLARAFGTLSAAFAQLGLRPLTGAEVRALRQEGALPRSPQVRPEHQPLMTERKEFHMVGANWFQNPNHGTHLRPEDLLPRLSRELGIPDLAAQVESFRRRPSPEGLRIRGRGRTTLRLLIPELLFSEPIDGGDRVWIYLGQSLPAYCLSPA